MQKKIYEKLFLIISLFVNGGKNEKNQLNKTQKKEKNIEKKSKEIQKNNRQEEIKIIKTSNFFKQLNKIIESNNFLKELNKIFFFNKFQNKNDEEFDEDPNIMNDFERNISHNNNYCPVNYFNENNLHIVKGLIEKNLKQVYIQSIFKQTNDDVDLDSDDSSSERTEYKIVLSAISNITSYNNRHYKYYDNKYKNINEYMEIITKNTLDNLNFAKMFRNLRSLNKIQKFLSRKVNFYKKVNNTFTLGDGIFSEIKIKKQEDNENIYNIQYIIEEHVSIGHIFQILVAKGLVTNQQDFIDKMQLGNSQNNKLHYTNIIDYYFNNEIINPYSIKCILEKKCILEDNKFKILDSTHFIEGIENKENIEQFPKLSELTNNTFNLLEEISKTTEKYFEEKIENFKKT
jgi:hypothetical protein